MQPDPKIIEASREKIETKIKYSKLRLSDLRKKSFNGNSTVPKIYCIDVP